MSGLLNQDSGVYQPDPSTQVTGKVGHRTLNITLTWITYYFRSLIYITLVPGAI
jgi:hypothetical protein